MYCDLLMNNMSLCIVSGNVISSYDHLYAWLLQGEGALASFHIKRLERHVLLHFVLL